MPRRSVTATRVGATLERAMLDARDRRKRQKGIALEAVRSRCPEPLDQSTLTAYL